MRGKNKNTEAGRPLDRNSRNSRRDRKGSSVETTEYVNAKIENDLTLVVNIRININSQWFQKYEEKYCDIRDLQYDFKML